MSWTFDPRGLSLVRSDGKMFLSEGEWVEQVGPLCQGCREQIDVAPVVARDINRPDEYIAGPWRCPTLGNIEVTALARWS